MPSTRRRRVVEEEESEEEMPQTQRRRRGSPSDESEEELPRTQRRRRPSPPDESEEELPRTQRRRRPSPPDESEEEMPRTQRRRRPSPPDESEEEDDDEDTGEGMYEDMDEDEQVMEQLVKKLIRYALACEFQRMPIRKASISKQVFLKKRVPFKRIFELAQEQLRTRFGMAMVELPVREKTTLKERRDALKKKTNSKAAVSYILTTTLPLEYRIPEIIPPSIIGSSAEEAQYVALYTTVVAIIALSNAGTLPNAKLEKHLARLNIERNMPMDTTANVLKRMATQQYIYRVVDRTGDEETIDWIVGPRGHTEIGTAGIQRVVEEVYGEKAPEDLAQRLHRSLGIELGRIDHHEDHQEEVDPGAPGPSTLRRSGRQRRLADNDQDTV